MSTLNPRGVKPLTEWQLAWLARFIDGEGSIGVYTTKGSSIGGKTNLRLTVCNTCVPIIDFIHQITGVGSVDYVAAKSVKWSNTACWRVRGMFELRDLLTKLLPYLLVKKDQAILVLECCDGKISKSPLHDDLYYHEKTKVLNHRSEQSKFMMFGEVAEGDG